MNMIFEQYPLVFDKIKCIYTPVCKAASNSLIKYFGMVAYGDHGHEREPTPQELNKLARLWRDQNQFQSLFSTDQNSEDHYLSYFMGTDEYKNYYKVAFVRNPWARVVAAFRELLRRSPFGEQKLNEPFGLSYREIYDLMQGYISFENFVNFIVNIEPDQLKGKTDVGGKVPIVNVHWRPQADILHIKNRFPNMEYDFIGKLENINEDFNYVQEQLGLEKTELYKDHVTQKYNHRLYYQTSKTIDLVGEYYKKDIEEFGYTYE